MVFLWGGGGGRVSEKINPVLTFGNHWPFGSTKRFSFILWEFSVLRGHFIHFSFLVKDVVQRALQTSLRDISRFSDKEDFHINSLFSIKCF